MEQENNFTVLENKAIGRNISIYRKIRDLKAFDVADKLKISEASYTRYERGESAITVDLLQQVAEVLKVDPITLLSTHPSNFIENGSNSPNAIVAMHAHNCRTTDEQQTQLLTKLVENITILNEKVISLLEKK